MDYPTLTAEQRLHRTKKLLNGMDRRSLEIYLAHRGGATYPEIATHWGVSYPVIKKSVVKALLTLMEHPELRSLR
jgi:hypothetical protein